MSGRRPARRLLPAKSRAGPGPGALALLALIGLALVADSKPPLAPKLDCAQAFDLLVSAATARCVAAPPSPKSVAAIADAVALLRGLALVEAAWLDDARIAFCPLPAGTTGLVPGPERLYLDDGLAGMSSAGLAEIVAHELVHLRQMAQLGPVGFKCAYLRAMLACGGCQDRRNAFEREAYAVQDAVRSQLLDE